VGFETRYQGPERFEARRQSSNPIHSRTRLASDLDFAHPHEAGMSRRVDWCVAHCSERMRNAASAMRA
jgi:hypothetical protein